MDGSSFDKLSVSVHRLREQASRRNALRLLAGGTAAAVAGAIVTEADAKKKKHKKNKYKNKYKKCRNNWYGGFCNGNKDCCNGKCRNGICWYNGGGGGRGGCGGVRCPNGWSCRKQGTVHICSPYNYPNYCGNNTYWTDNNNCCSGYAGGACPVGWECCGSSGCCAVGQKCCGNGRCCPDGWYCGNITCESRQAADISGESVETQPFIAAVPPDAGDSFVFVPGTAE
ncbi:MAG: hypothetical protein R2853_04100 [Thermomicrobiales bacterium]|nr:hypothetical protein [Thermomicrobiales bacterium]